MDRCLDHSNSRVVFDSAVQPEGGWRGRGKSKDLLRRALVHSAQMLLCAILLAPGVVQGYNAAGHKIIAEIAWQKLSVEDRRSICETLRAHPRFAEDFKEAMVEEVGGRGVDVENHWIFCHAATWPDIARGIPAADRGEFHRPRWHYINLPVFLNPTQAADFIGRLPANVEFELSSDVDEESLNGVQAVKNSLNLLSDSSATKETRAIHYCWLLHVVADLHQPLHTSALFTSELFPTGDQGGNKITVKREGNAGNGQKLHALWDGFLGRGASFNSVQSKASQLVSDHPALFNIPPLPLPFDVWTTQTQSVALESAYGPILADVEEAEEAGEPLETIELPEAYFRTGGEVTRRQAVLAGVRLAGVLHSTLSGERRESFATPRRLGFAAAIPTTQPTNAESSDMTPEGALTSTLRGLTRRVEALEATVKALSKGHVMHGLEAAPASEADDGEQCTCGADE